MLTEATLPGEFATEQMPLSDQKPPSSGPSMAGSTAPGPIPVGVPPDRTVEGQNRLAKRRKQLALVVMHLRSDLDNMKALADHLKKGEPADAEDFARMAQLIQFYGA